MKKLKFKFKYTRLNYKSEISKINNKQINIVNFLKLKVLKKYPLSQNDYIEKSCDIALELLKRTSSKVLINGPISKKFF